MKGIKYYCQDKWKNAKTNKKLFMFPFFPLNCETILLYFQLLLYIIKNIYTEFEYRMVLIHIFLSFL